MQLSYIKCYTKEYNTKKWPLESLSQVTYGAISTSYKWPAGAIKSDISHRSPIITRCVLWNDKSASLLAYDKDISYHVGDIWPV